MTSFTFLLLSLSFAIGLNARPQSNALSRHSESRFRSSVRSASLAPRLDNSTDHKHSDPTCAPYWLENIKHQGVASFNKDASYQVFRNVKDFGAVGDGKTDDTAAIQKAISEGGRCKPGECHSSTTTPAIVYFPQGIYLISASIIDYYYTQIIGNPNCLPTIIASKDFDTATSLGLIDGSPYQATGKTGFGPTNTFFRQVRNLILDTTQIPASSLARGIHWPTAQTTTLQNLIFKLSAENGTQHEGVFIEEGSGGFMADLTFHGGNYGFNVGNQQFTTRNLTFKNCVTAINQLWDWGWTYKSVSIQDCQVGFNISAGGPSAVNVGSVTIIDSEIINTPIGVVTSRTSDSKPDGAGSFYAENIKVQNVGTLYSSIDGKTTISGPNGTEPSVVAAFAHGRRYISNGDEVKHSTEVGDITPTKRPKTLVNTNGKFYERSKPQYETLPLDKFLSARSEGARGDGVTDDTVALNAAILKAKSENKILFVDAGFYLVTKTIYIPPGAKIVGEALASVILSSGDFFNSMTNPQPVVKVAEPGERGTIEWSDMFVSTQGQQAGAILIEYNLGSYEEPAGMWDVHTRIGGFAGSKLQSEQCPTTPKEDNAKSIAEECIAAYISMHVTKFGTGLYMENNWLWTADHDLDDSKNNDTQITIYTGRGLLIESIRGTLWLYGTAVEHHSKYQYQFVDTRDIVMGQIQTETAYYQPNPDATKPFHTDVARYDPIFEPSSDSSTNSANGWGLRILRSSNLLA